MSLKVTNEEIIQMNILYKKLGTYAAVSREVGRAAGTVKKYIIPDFIIPEEAPKQKFIDIDYLNDINRKDLIYSNRICDLLDNTPEEEKEMEKLWKEILL